MSSFGTNIKKIRQVKGLSQKAFADLFDLNRGVISSYEEGRAEPKIETILKVAGYFNLDLDKLLTETLQVNQLASVSDIDQLMFAPQQIVKSIHITEAHSANQTIMQKILASVDLIYEFTPQHQLLPPYQYGDILFLNKTDAKKSISNSLLIHDNGQLMYASEASKPDQELYKIVGSVSTSDKSVFTDIFERLDNLEKQIRKG
ncbi:transcriptional regulator with XRE-family HTH domain [Chryseobacterium sp. 52]|uniref:helix-turn-helix domain-containing protein n=1 Tax=Chryseobacterium sp. 52 TaxID=2035213 RepID=UPI000C18B119|nr:helix-turn-helix transcriptional regulator [Chryseobacterium sp. 52]PIF43876.1 transcriptional regulator with XRE-family HTH domain [Chryseobacterium sp. 52]